MSQRHLKIPLIPEFDSQSSEGTIPGLQNLDKKHRHSILSGPKAVAHILVALLIMGSGGVEWARE